MENREENSHGAAIPEKSRSLDLKCLHKPRATKELQNNNLKRNNNSSEDADWTRNKKKTRKEVSLSSFGNVNDSSKKSVDEVCSGQFSSGSRDTKDLKSGLSQKSNGSSEFDTVSLSLNDNFIWIPKRKRGFAGRKKFEGSQVLKPVDKSNSKVALVDHIDNSSPNDSGTQVESSKVKQKKVFDEFKENRNSELNLVRHSKEEGHVGLLVVNNGDLSLTKPQRNCRKRRDLTSDCKSVVKEAVPLVDNSIRISDELREDDEENLEENAARMLSSRFNPSCTGFSSSSKASAFQSMNGLSFLSSPDRDFVGCASKSLSGSESASVDTAFRVLRPRKQHKEKGHLRKRRHFYELFFGDLDAYWVLNRRIKVFWPLDQSWYYGVVNDYDKERKLHHVKYDDRDEEWINLKNERFKLLLLPSEVPGKAGQKKSFMRNRSSHEGKRHLKGKQKEKKDLTTEDDGCIGSFMDSEPIISWLARSTRRIKISPSCAAKKQKTSSPSLQPVSVGSSDEAVNLHCCLDGVSSRRDHDKSKLPANSESPDRLPDTVRLERPTLATTCPKDSKTPIVYFRRRLHKSGPDLFYTSEDTPVSRTAPGSIASFCHFDDKTKDFKEPDVSIGRLDTSLFDNIGLLDFSLTPLESWRFELSFPVQLVLNDSFGADNFWFFQAILLLQHGIVMTMWQKVQLEMLFVDNVVGLRFLLFEGCIKQVVDFVFLVLRVFHEPKEQGKYVDSQLPVTSIRFRFSSVHDARKQLVFAIYNFSQLKKSKWLHLDRKLKSYCLLTRQLPLSECTYDNIHAFQNGGNQLPITSDCGRPSSIKGLRKRSNQGISVMGLARDCTYVNISEPSSNSNEMSWKLTPFALCFAAAPTFFLSLHLKLLMERRVAHISLQGDDLVGHPENSGFVVDDCSVMEDCSKDTGANNLKALSKDTACDGWLSCGKSVDRDCIKFSWKCKNVNLDVAGTSAAGSQDSENVGTDAIVQLQKWQSHHSEPELCVLLPRPSFERDKSDTSSHSFLNGLSVEIPLFNQIEKPEEGELNSAQHSTDLSWSMNGGIIPSPNPTAPRSTWHRNKNNLSSFGYLSNGWSEGKADIFQNGFGNGPKRPRTQVSYPSPLGDFDVNLKHRSHHHKVLPHKRIRRGNEKRSFDVPRGSQRNMELLSCDVNVLITLGDRGWRECGAQVVLELFDHNECRLAVKLSGTTKYSYKAHQFLQPGSTNRYTHAMMWKGGKDWILEFPDRSQWALFKEMHEECYNRNIRAALIKNIPIPGVRLIEENDDSGTEIAFVRSSSKYLRQVETDVELALDPSHVLYDMDSDDEQWILNNPPSAETDNCILGKITEEMFEKTMDRFEKAAYAQECDQFTPDEIEDLTHGVGAMDITKSIYEHWRQKRQKKGMPLIRHLQPPLWEKYQQQVDEWELAMTKVNTNLPNGCQEKAAPIEKPPMFAFCLKPRGLEVPNKGSKQRSQRKFSVAGHNNAILGDQDGVLAFGKRLNGFAIADDKAVYPGHYHEALDDSPFPQASPRIFSPQNAGNTGLLFSTNNDGFDRNQIPRLQRNKSKKFGTFVSQNDQHMVMLYNQRMMDKINGVPIWNRGSPERPRQQHYHLDGSQRHGVERLDGSDLDEFRLRDASGAAQHAVNMAKLKREKAQRLLYRADLTIHKAVVALMTAEAIKASAKDINGDG